MIAGYHNITITFGGRGNLFTLSNVILHLYCVLPPMIEDHLNFNSCLYCWCMRAKIDICVILQQLFIFKRIHCWFVINMRWPITYCMSLYESIWHFVWIHYMISGILYLFTIMSHYIVVAVINISGDKKHILLTIAWMLLIHTLNNF